MGVLRHHPYRFLLPHNFIEKVNPNSTDEDDLSPLVSSQLYIHRLLPCGLLSWPSIAHSRLHQHYCAEDESVIAVPKSYSVIGE
jgi:hypothetical protein